MTGLPGQLANEPIADYKKCFQAQLAFIEAEEQHQLAAAAAQLQAEEAATAEKLRLQAEADADAQAHRKEAQDLLQRHEANSIDRLKFWHFEPNGDEATPEEQHKEFMAKLVTSSASSSRQLEEHVDHVVAMLEDISAFTEPATISQRLELLDTKISQQQQTDHNHNNSSARPYKMPTFRIEKFDDYTHQDPVVWWQGFTTELGIHEVPDHLFISALFINTKGGCQIWLRHMATIHDIQVSDLYKKVSWEDMTKEWKKRFIVDDAPTLAINRIFTMAQGSTPTRDWLTDWQKIVSTPDLDLPFPHLHREFYNRSCAALSLALGDREQYNTFAEITNKAREVIKTNRAAAHEKSTWQPTYVEKEKEQEEQGKEQGKQQEKEKQQEGEQEKEREEERQEQQENERERGYGGIFVTLFGGGAGGGGGGGGGGAVGGGGTRESRRSEEGEEQVARGGVTFYLFIFNPRLLGGFSHATIRPPSESGRKEVVQAGGGGCASGTRRSEEGKDEIAQGGGGRKTDWRRWHEGEEEVVRWEADVAQGGGGRARWMRRGKRTREGEEEVAQGLGGCAREGGSEEREEVPRGEEGVARGVGRGRTRERRRSRGGCVRGRRRSEDGVGGGGAVRTRTSKRLHKGEEEVAQGRGGGRKRGRSRSHEEDERLQRRSEGRLEEVARVV
ncbi:hypothetical protein CBR_g66798 [Chara braunii]|uniref:Uncharacterized protein n=1 Tax=Chara braunii TaxID=69332 RepID=A0A388K9P9_CHABU|nr:hypothetical protein CBR_g66798 [Chara braunii]|eukprot:GBG66663.1 hypothetical protein CBR_g66798 [Chara braunii]